MVDTSLGRGYPNVVTKLDQNISNELLPQVNANELNRDGVTCMIGPNAMSATSSPFSVSGLPQSAIEMTLNWFNALCSIPRYRPPGLHFNAVSVPASGSPCSFLEGKHWKVLAPSFFLYIGIVMTHIRLSVSVQANRRPQELISTLRSRTVPNPPSLVLPPFTCPPTNGTGQWFKSLNWLMRSDCISTI